MLNLLKPEYQHADSRRTISQLITDNIKQVNSYQVTKGAILGEHYHRFTNEYFYVTKGTFVVFVNEVGKKQSMSRILNKQSFFMARSGLVHTIEALTNGEFLTFLTKPFDPKEPDLCREKP